MQNAGTITLRGKALLVTLDAWKGPGDLVIGAGDLRGLLAERRTVKLWHVVRGGDVDTIEHVGAVWVTKTGRGLAVKCDRLAGLTAYAAAGLVRDVLAGRRRSAPLGVPTDPAPAPRSTPARRDPINDGLRRGFGEVRV